VFHQFLSQFCAESLLLLVDTRQNVFHPMFQVSSNSDRMKYTAASIFFLCMSILAFISSRVDTVLAWCVMCPFLCSVSVIVCVVLCAVFRLIVVLFCVMCVICVLSLIVVPLPPGKYPFAVKINNNYNNNNIHLVYKSTPKDLKRLLFQSLFWPSFVLGWFPSQLSF
jgi:hypothetical protein